jgi:tRNA(adenine34) deaminase
VVYAAADPKAGACGSVLNVLAEKKLNHRPAVTGGLLADEAGQLLKDFFKAARKKRRPFFKNGACP